MLQELSLLGLHFQIYEGKPIFIPENRIVIKGRSVLEPKREEKKKDLKPSPTALGAGQNKGLVVDKPRKYTLLELRTIAKQQGFTGDICGLCGSMNVVKTGTCGACTNCGTTTGCS